jgi:hypothetical protein
LLFLVAATWNFLIGSGAERLSPATQAILPMTAALALIADVEGPPQAASFKWQRH